ncbi:MAG TPA: amidohydrolase family protein [Reyranella sp.]|nr:amidohydrolase family protein [Reyranella sp.]
MSSLAVRARWALVHEEGAARIVTDRWIVAEGDRIAAIVADKPSAEIVIDRPDLFVLPGLINLHNHVFTEALIRGRSEDLSKDLYETNLVYGLLMPLGKLAMDHLSPADCEAIAEMGLMQLMKSGVTTLMESFRSGLTEPFVSAATRAGLRFYAGPYLFSTPDLDIDADGRPTYKDGGGDADAASIEQWRALYQRHHGTHDDRIRVTLSPHATDTCSPDLLRKVRGLADEHKCLATIHVAQSREEVAKSRQLHGRTPTELLESVGLLGPDVLLAHCLFSSDSDLDIARRHDATVINCPRTFARGGATAAFGRFQRRGLRTVVGTDGYVPDMVSELRAAGMVSKLAAQDPGVATAAQLVDAVTTMAATALGRNDIGRLAVGAKADIAAIRLDGAHVVPVTDPRNAMIWRVHATDVWASAIDGKPVVNEGRYLAGDEPAIVARAGAVLAKVEELARSSGILARAK